MNWQCCFWKLALASETDMFILNQYNEASTTEMNLLVGDTTVNWCGITIGKNWHGPGISLHKMVTGVINKKATKL